MIYWAGGGLARLPTPQIRQLLSQARTKGLEASKSGQVLQSIPILADVSPERFAISVALLDGREISDGNHAEPFSIQSISKLFALASLIQSKPSAWPDLNWQPTHLGYRSLAELEADAGRPRNPFVNAGALQVTDQLIRATGSSIGATLNFLRKFAENFEIAPNPAVAESEKSTSDINLALAHVLAAHGQITNEIATVLDHYLLQCAIEATTDDLAKAARFFANSGEPGVMSTRDLHRINSVLTTAGMYEESSDFAFNIGLPAKSGVGGGIIAAIPGVGGVAVWSPPLNNKGNSIGGIEALRVIADTALSA